ncbi:MAG: hypothetical protein KDE53_06255 [Caldilineaceae bacterium]|nr:hypothetical protein [Caldilineaceae bacterium]
MARDFDRQLGFGRAGESAIAMWLRRRGYSVLPVYEKIIDEGKGPQLFTPTQSLIAPDLLAFRGDDQLWIEAKHKTAFSWYRKEQKWVTGIDLHHYKQYLLVAESAPWPVWLLFLHRGGQAKDSPPDSPAGLFGNKLSFLKDNESHRSDKYGRTGMVYWARQSLHKLAEINEIVGAVDMAAD